MSLTKFNTYPLKRGICTLAKIGGAVFALLFFLLICKTDSMAAQTTRTVVFRHIHTPECCLNPSKPSQGYKCGFLDGDEEGSATLMWDETNWTNKGIKVRVLLSLRGDIFLKSKPFSLDNGALFKETEFTINDNGFHTLEIFKENGMPLKPQVDIRLTNIDKDAPRITGMSLSDANWTTGNVTVNVTATDDLSGLDSQAYSFDGGASYSKNQSVTVSDNGTVTVTVRDKAGNTASKSIDVKNIDRTGPNIASFGPGNTVWTKEGLTLYVDASDGGSGLASKAFCYDGVNYVSSSEFPITDNGYYTVSVKDNLGNISTKSVTIDNIDRRPPVISGISKSHDSWTSSDVTIKVNASDDVSGLADAAFSFDGGVSYQGSNEFTVSENKAVNICVMDKAGNVATASSNVSMIDRDGPVISAFAKNTDIWTNSAVTLSVTASDAASGLNPSPYSFDGGKTYKSDSTFKVSENGDYSVIVKDRVGNITSKVINVNNIDKEAPSVSITKSTEDWSEDGVVLTIEASDSGSGLSGNAYSFDNGAKYISSKSARIKTNGTYTICVKDNAGNVASETIKIGNIGKNPSKLEKEALEKQKEAERKAKEQKAAEEEKRKAEEIRKKNQTAYNSALTLFERRVKEAEEAAKELEKIVAEKEALIKKLNEAIDAGNADAVSNYEAELEKIKQRERELLRKVSEAKALVESARKALETAAQALTTADSDYKNKIKEAEAASRALDEAKEISDNMDLKVKDKSSLLKKISDYFKKNDDPIEYDEDNESKENKSNTDKKQYMKGDTADTKKSAVNNSGVNDTGFKSTSSGNAQNRWGETLSYESSENDGRYVSLLYDGNSEGEAYVQDFEYETAGELEDYSGDENLFEDEGGAPIPGDGSEDMSKKSNKGILPLAAGIILILAAVFVMLSVNYVYIRDGKRIKGITRVSVTKDSNRMVINVGGDKLKDNARYSVCLSMFNRLGKAGRNIYVMVRGRDGIINCDSDNSFVYTA